jgi:mRNA-degrading endonuclease RelE of RelBE toxin-antitoxin system
MKQFTLEVPKTIEAELGKFRAAIRQLVRKRLREIVEGLTAGPPARRKAARLEGPPLRFYVAEGCRVSYQVNPATRKVVVLALKAESG